MHLVGSMEAPVQGIGSHPDTKVRCEGSDVRVWLWEDFLGLAEE